MQAKLMTIIMTLLAGFFLYKIIAIDNMSRLPENINTDFHMHALPFIYGIIVSLIVILLINIVQVIKMKKV